MSDEYLERIEDTIHMMMVSERQAKIPLNDRDMMIYRLYNAYILLKKEYYNLKDNYKELEQILNFRNNRDLINKFNKEFDEEDKIKNPNRDYASTYPDAEEVYKRYYQLKDNQKRIIDYIINKIQKSFNYDYGIDNSNPNYRLFAETITELQLIKTMLEDKK